MKLIIAEKPNLAKNIALALKSAGENVLNEGSFFKTDNYYIIGAFGHLYELADLEEHLNREKTKWMIEDLPFYPKNEFKFKAKNNSGIKERINIIKKLLNDNDITEVINCGDADREGEIIIRIILSQLNNVKAVKRLWIADQTEKTILEGLNSLHAESEYDSLSNEGFARMYSDYLFGINYTRYATIKSATLINVGRVISPIINAIYQRDLLIRNFIPEQYYSIESNEETNGSTINFVDVEKIGLDEKSKFENRIKELNCLSAVVSDKKTRETTKQSPKLFSQSKLQNHLAKLYKYKPSKTLDICQKLYEKGLISYPRTNTEYLAEAEADVMIELLACYQEELVVKKGKKIYDDSKIESHSALTPTFKSFTTNLNLDEEETKVYNEIKSRFFAVFCKEDCIVSETTIYITIGKRVYEKKGNEVIKQGFLKYTNQKFDKELPALEKGDLVNIKFAFNNKETNVPKHYTVSTLNNYLKNPLSKSDNTDNDYEEYKNLLDGLEIGTEATRPGIIDNALKNNFIELDKDIFKITDHGISYVNCLKDLEIDMSIETSAYISKDLKSVYKNEKNINEVLDSVFKIISETIHSNKDTTNLNNANKEVLGICPRCKSNVYENAKAYSCENYDDCKFILWKNNKFLAASKKQLTASLVKTLLKSGSAAVSGLVSKSGSKYNCILKIEDTGEYINLKPVFNNKR